MRIVVPIKQVPETSDVKMDPETGTIVRSGSQAVVNPLDLYAVETALGLKEERGGTVTAISMGPISATKALREVLAMGCDEARLLSDRRFGGADTWATSYVLSRGIAELGEIDLVICGERATDGDTAQVGPGIAAWLDLPVVTYVSGIRGVEMKPGATGGTVISAERLVEKGYQQVRAALPALITVVKEIAEPRLPTLEGKKRASRAKIPVFGAEDMDLDAAKLGLPGSPTKVVKIRSPKIARGGRVVSAEGNVAGATGELVDFLRQRDLV